MLEKLLKDAERAMLDTSTPGGNLFEEGCGADAVARNVPKPPQGEHFSFCWYFRWYLFGLTVKNLASMRVSSHYAVPVGAFDQFKSCQNPHVYWHGGFFVSRGFTRYQKVGCFLEFCWPSSLRRKTGTGATSKRRSPDPGVPKIWHRFGTFRPVSRTIASAGCSASSQTVDFIEEIWSG